MKTSNGNPSRIRKNIFIFSSKKNFFIPGLLKLPGFKWSPSQYHLSMHHCASLLCFQKLYFAFSGIGLGKFRWIEWNQTSSSYEDTISRLIIHIPKGLLLFSSQGLFRKDTAYYAKLGMLKNIKFTVLTIFNATDQRYYINSQSYRTIAIINL